MLHRITWIAPLLLIGVAAADAADDPAELKRENARLKARVRQLEAEVARLREAKAALESQLTQVREDRNEAFFDEQTTEGGASQLVGRVTRLAITHGGNAPHGMRLVAGDEGPIRMFVETEGSGDDYRGIDQVHFTVDGRELAAEVANYRAQRRVIGRKRVNRGDERFTALLPVDLVERIAEADEVTGRIKHVRFRLTDGQRRMFRAFRDRLAEGNKRQPTTAR